MSEDSTQPREEKDSKVERADSPQQLTPLWIISLFVSLTETALGILVSQTGGDVQIALTAFVIVFPFFVASAFFWILSTRAQVLYPPGVYEKVNVKDYAEAVSTRFTKPIAQASDLQEETTILGNPDRFQLLFKVTGKVPGGYWKKSTKAMEVEGGCLVQVTTEQTNPDGSLSVAEAVTFVPGVKVEADSEGKGRHLSSI